MPPPINIRGQAFSGWQSAPLQTPGGAFGRSLARGNIPGASFFMDQPQNAQGAPWWMKVLSGLPFVGSLASAGGAAMGQQTLNRDAGMTRDYGYTQFMGEPEGMGSRAWSSLGAGLKWAPGGPVVDPMRMAYNVIQGAQGMNDFVSSNFPQFGAAMGGMATRGLADRTGLLGNGGFSPWGGGGGTAEAPVNDLQSIFGGIPGATSSEPNFAAQGPRDWSQERGG